MVSDGFGRARGGPLDEGLARMARREELRQRTAAASEGAAGSGPAGSGPAGSGPAGSALAEPWIDAQGATHQSLDQPPSAGSPIDELADAVRAIMRRHPEFSVSMTVREADVTWRLRSERRGGAAQVIVTSAEPAATMPAMLEPPPPAHGTPSRLAELLRQNPGILDEGR